MNFPRKRNIHNSCIFAKTVIFFKLLIIRGEPIPVIYDDDKEQFLTGSSLPVSLPEIEPGSIPKPLSQNEDFYKLDGNRKRAVDTFDTYVDIL